MNDAGGAPARRPATETKEVPAVNDVNDVNDVSLVAADAVPAADLHATFVAAFADHLHGPIQTTLAQWPTFVARQAVDLATSRVACRDGHPLAFALVAPRPATGRWRLAVMGAVPAARGTGAAAALLDDVIARAGAAGVPEVELECFAQNERALKFYRSRGFAAVQALHGWSQPADASRRAASRASVAPPREVDRASAFAWLADAERRLPNLPLQVTPPSLAAAVRPLTSWRIGSAQLVFSFVAGTPTQVHSLADTNPAQDDAQALLRCLRVTHPAEEIVIPALQRDDLGGDAARREGFAPQALHQVLMVLNVPTVLTVRAS